MCLTLQGYPRPPNPREADETAPLLSERKLLKKLYQDLERHSGAQRRGVDLLDLLKATQLGDLLGKQLFQALDLDRDGVLGKTDFIEGLLRLCKGSDKEIFRVWFDLLDFNRKEYVTPHDLRTLATALPTTCLVCGQYYLRSWRLDEVLAQVFEGAEVHSFQSLWEIRGKVETVVMDIIATVVNSLPRVLLDILGREDVLACSKAFDKMCILANCPISILKYGSRSYFFTLRSGCLFGFTSLSVGLPKVLIFAKDLFVSPVGETEFELRNCCTVYSFTASSQGERDQWVDSIAEDQLFRWFDDFYEAGEVLGTGGQARVFRAASRGAGQPAAVKIVSKEGLQAGNEERVRREISILRLSSHPNVMQLYDVFETSERFYLVTEMFTEGTLFGWLEKRSFKVSESVAKWIIADIAKGLLYLHCHGVVHRDLKLENVMLRQSKGGRLEAVLIDFGMSCFLGPEQYSTEPVGTLKYAAPEVISRLPYGFKADCWSLGVILYILLVGRMPFYGKNDPSIAVKVLKKPVQFSTEKWVHVSAAAKSVVTGLLTRKAEDRWSPEAVLGSAWLAEERKAANTKT